MYFAISKTGRRASAALVVVGNDIFSWIYRGQTRFAFRPRPLQARIRARAARPASSSYARPTA